MPTFQTKVKFNKVKFAMLHYPLHATSTVSATGTVNLIIPLQTSCSKQFNTLMAIGLQQSTEYKNIVRNKKFFFLARSFPQ